MNFSLAFIKNSNQFMLQNYHSGAETFKAQLLSLDELSNSSVQAIFVPQDICSNHEVIEALDQELSHTPLRPIENSLLSADEFDALAKEKAWDLFKKTHSSWVLKNNLALLENLIPTINHLKALWPNDRTTFFEELWSLLKKNLGAKHLRVAYNHMHKATKEHEKNKLIRVIVEGDKTPQPIENKELGETLFKNYEGKFDANFEAYDQEENGNAIFLASVNDSPIIIMAELYNSTKIQQALLKALFDGLQN